MTLFEKIGLPNEGTIDWEITPELTFTMFESWGSRLRVFSLNERYYYFFIDNWQDPAVLCLMERGVKYARVIAEINAPQDMLSQCIAEQGDKIGLDRSFAINNQIKEWIVEHIIDSEDHSRVTVIHSGLEVEDLATNLPLSDETHHEITPVSLDQKVARITEEDIPEIVSHNNFFEAKLNPTGTFTNYLTDNNDGLTVTDQKTGIMWQRNGCDITSIRKTNKEVEALNNQSFAGYNDWRLPSIEEALSIMTSEKNEKGLHLHPCFSKAQPFIFLAEQRKPGGYWFADFKQGTIYWASGFNPGGFSRFCRTIN